MKFMLFILLTMLAVVLYFYLKNIAAYRNQFIIIDAIARYVAACEECEVEPIVHFYDMESYRETLFRWWDWGYTRIVDPVQYEIIKPFIKGGANND